MGTSGTFGGSKSGLVPSWVDEPLPKPAKAPGSEPSVHNGPEDGEIGDRTEGPPALYPPLGPLHIGSDFRVARANLTRGARTSDVRAIRRGAGQYVSAVGGGRAAARRMPSSRVVAAGIANLARTVSDEGATEALRRFNLDGLAGAPAVDVFVALTDALCPPGGTIDEAIARDAMVETIAELAAEGIGNFDELTPEDLQEFFIGVVSRSIEGKILNEVGTKTIRLSPNLDAVERAQRMLHDFVDGCVRDRFSASGASLSELTTEEIDDFVSTLYEAAFDLIRTLGDTE